MATKIMDCDLVVLGAGGSGMVAAVKAADISGKKVIVLEKAKKPGGNTIFAHGMPIKDSKWQKEAGEAVKEPQAISGQFFDWLVTKGGAEEYFRMAKPGETRVAMSSLIMTRRLDKYKDHQDPTIGPGWIGSYVVGKMLECCEKMSIPILTETRAKKFITDASGKVTGVLADTKDGELQVNCKACFIGAGGFGANYERCKKYWPDIYNNKPKMCLSIPTCTGDWLEMAEEIGIPIDLSNAFNTGGSAPTHHPYSYTVLKMTGSMMAVNHNGERFPATGGSSSLNDQPMAGCFAIADQDILEAAGKACIASPNEDIDLPICKKWREEVAYEVAIDEAGAHGHHAKKADTLLELALKMDVDPSVFVATIEAYNKSCENPTDQNAGGPGGPGGGAMPMFGSGDSSLPPGFGGNEGAAMPGGGGGGPGGNSPSPIRKPPFYAFYQHRFTQTTKGGIVVNYDTMEVFDKNGKIIPGLFAGGDCITPKGLKRTEAGYGLWNCITTGYKGGVAAGKYISKA